MRDARDLEALTKRISEFAHVRDWEKFHTPRNLVLALTGEVGELAAEFQWVGEHDQLERDHIERVAAELADITIYLLRLAQVLGVDLGESVVRKIDQNEIRYPADQSRGSSAKYTEYE